MKQTRSARRRHRRVSPGLAASAVALGAAAIATAPAASAATFTVTNTNDNGAGSLRDAIAQANTTAGADTITFQSGVTGTITLTTGELYVSDSVDIQGPGAATLAVSGNDSSRVFYLYNGSSLIDVTISGLTITHGTAYVGGGVADYDENATLDDVVVTSNYAAFGGGVAVGGSNGVLTVRDSTVSGNAGLLGGGGVAAVYADTMSIENSVVTNNGGTYGGGIVSLGQTGPLTIDGSTIADNQALVGAGLAFAYGEGTLTVTDSTISGNSAYSGGGVYLYGFSDAVLFQNTTISGNEATGVEGAYGGGIAVYAVYNGTLTLDLVTIANNTAAEAGGGVYLGSGEMTITNSVIADNTALDNPDLGGGAESTFETAYSLVENPDTANITDNGGNIFNQDPDLGPLQNNGGPTETHLPQTGSVVINAGDPAFTPPPSTDQRGSARVVNGRVDMGAVEVNPGTLAFSAAASNVPENGGIATITVVRTGGTDGAVAADYDTSDGSAAEPGDYTATSGTVSFASGDATPQSFNVPIIDDAMVEGNETFDATLSNPTNGAVIGSPSVHTVTIADFEAGSVQFSSATANVDEGAGTITLTLTRTGGSNGPLSVDVKTSDGSATAGSDYTSTAVTVTFADGQTSATVVIPIIDDSLTEPAETFTATISNATAGSIGSPSTAAVTINASDAATIPALDVFGKIALALASMLAGLWAIGRKHLWSVLFAVALVAAMSGPMYAQQRAHHRGKGGAWKFFGEQNAAKVRGVLSAITKDEKSIVLTFDSGKSVTLDASKVKVVDTRNGKQDKVAPDALAVGQTVVVRTHGNAARVRIVS